MTRPVGPAPDAGLQAERTVLAWRRTGLAMALAAVVAGRLAVPVFGVVALVLTGVGLLQAVAVAAAAGRRYGAMRQSLDAVGRARPHRPGVPIAALACAGTLTGVLALLVVVGPLAGR